MQAINLALDERLAVQKVLIQLSLDCGSALEDARSSAKSEIDRLVAAGDAVGIARLKMRARMFDQPARSQAAAPVNKGAPAVPAAPGATALTSSHGSQPTIR